MMFSTRSEYGVRVMIQLARRRGSGPVPLTGIAEAESLPLAYLEQLVSRLRKADLVASTRGAHGGYELSRDPAEITMAEVVQALEGSLIPMQCFDELGGTRVLCNHVEDGFENFGLIAGIFQRRTCADSSGDHQRRCAVFVWQ